MKGIIKSNIHDKVNHNSKVRGNITNNIETSNSIGEAYESNKRHKTSTTESNRSKRHHRHYRHHRGHKTYVSHSRR